MAGVGWCLKSRLPLDIADRWLSIETFCAPFVSVVVQIFRPQQTQKKHKRGVVSVGYLLARFNDGSGEPSGAGLENKKAS